jgi:hypothetical protein
MLRRTIARSSSQAVRQKSSTSFEREAVSEKSAWEKFKPNAQAFGIVAGTAAVVFSAGYSMATSVDRLDKDLALAAKDLALVEVRVAKDLELAEMRAAKDLEVAEARAAKDLEVSNNVTMERFLLYGYAEEYQRYQKQAGIHKGGK